MQMHLCHTVWAGWALLGFYVAAHPSEVVAAQEKPSAASSNRCPAGAIALTVGDVWEAKVRAARAGAVFCVRSGVHRAQTVFPKDNQMFLGESGAVMNGTVIIDDVRRDGVYWMAPGPTWNPEIRGVCLRSKPMCSDPTSLFIDGRLLEQVPSLEQVRPGTFFREAGTGRLYFVDDPEGKTIEATAAAFAFMPNHAKNVVIRGLVVEKYGNPSQLGAIYADVDAAATGWLIENNEVRLNSGSGIVGGQGAIVRGNRVHDNGHLGIHPNGDSVLIANNEIAFNNTRGFDPQWDAGGLKAAVVKNLVVRDNWVHHNHGAGLWCDIECRRVTFDGNTVEYNTDAGIVYEISYDADIVRNLVRWNGQGGDGSHVHTWTAGAEIQIAGSSNVNVDHNTIFVGKDGGGILLIDQGRDKDGKKDYYRTVNNAVHDNNIWLSGPGVKLGGISDLPPGDPNYAVIENGDNSFDGNQYHVLHDNCACVFSWGHATYDFAGFQKIGQEKTGRMLPSSVEPEAPAATSSH